VKVFASGWRGRQRSFAGSRASSGTSTATACRHRDVSAHIGGDAAGRVYPLPDLKTGALSERRWTSGGSLGSGVEGLTSTATVCPTIAARQEQERRVFSGKDGHALLTFSAEKISDNFGQHV
jgi:hypothetical protein